MEFTYQVDPNMNAEEYRNLSVTDRPPVPDKQLQVIKVFKNESIIVGASNMIDRQWNGTLSYYNELEHFDRDNAFAAYRTESGISDAAFLEKHDKCLIGEDSGTVQIVQLHDVENNAYKQKFFKPLHYACQHDDSLISLSVFENNTQFVSGGIDCCIIVWDMAEGLGSTCSYNSAHKDTVTCVDAQPRSNSIFTSTSIDGDALTWDIRKPKPAHGIFRRNNCGLTAIAWKPNDENILAIGAEDGSVSVIDIRNPNAEPICGVSFDRPVYKLEFNPQIPNQLAGCCDGNIVKIFDTDKYLTELYEDYRHKDFVRGLAWSADKLLTCSWDNTVIEHSLVDL